ncbi:Uncharacterised protein [Vibrio cholerae]|nr:Uncharacterised protein [Vibrio cholerae]
MSVFAVVDRELPSDDSTWPLKLPPKSKPARNRDIFGTLDDSGLSTPGRLPCGESFPPVLSNLPKNPLSATSLSPVFVMVPSPPTLRPPDNTPDTKPRTASFLSSPKPYRVCRSSVT